MKVVQGTAATVIYPFLLPDAEVSGHDNRIVAREDGTVKLIWVDAPLMSAEAARKLAEALLHASEVAEKGQK